jgi:hypothetical protein
MNQEKHEDRTRNMGMVLMFLFFCYKGKVVISFYLKMVNGAITSILRAIIRVYRAIIWIDWAIMNDFRAIIVLE